MKRYTRTVRSNNTCWMFTMNFVCAGVGVCLVTVSIITSCEFNSIMSTTLRFIYGTGARDRCHTRCNKEWSKIFCVAGGNKPSNKVVFALPSHIRAYLFSWRSNRLGCMLCDSSSNHKSPKNFRKYSKHLI